METDADRVLGCWTLSADAATPKPPRASRPTAPVTIHLVLFVVVIVLLIMAAGVLLMTPTSPVGGELSVGPG